MQARLIVQLKDNQPSLLQKVETACASQRPVSSDTSVCTGRNRHETRSADVFSATRAVAATEWNSLGPVDKPVLAPVQPERFGRCGHGMTR